MLASDMHSRAAGSPSVGSHRWTRHSGLAHAIRFSRVCTVARYMALFALERYEETIAMCRSVAALYPHHAGAWRLMTVSLGLLGRLDEARKSLAHTLTLQPDLSSDHVTKNTVLPTHRIARAFSGSAEGRLDQLAAYPTGPAVSHLKRWLVSPRNLNRPPSTARAS